MELITFKKEQVDLIKSQIAPNATDSELKLFLYQCQRTGLDPLTRQIYCIHRGGKMTIQTSIDGFRVIAERSGSYAGQDEPIFTYDEKGNPLSCKITVYKFAPSGERYPAATGVVFFNEYAQYDREGRLQGLWASKKHVMLSKVCEAVSLRRAFPQDLSGLYTSDEMNEEPVVVKLESKPQINDAQFNAVLGRMEKGEDLYQKTVDTFTLNPAQNRLLKSIQLLKKENGKTTRDASAVAL